MPRTCSHFSVQTQRKLFQILFSQTEIRLYLPFSNWVGSKRTSIWFQFNRKIVNTIRFRVDLIKLRKNFTVCTTRISTVLTTHNLSFHRNFDNDNLSSSSEYIQNGTNLQALLIPSLNESISVGRYVDSSHWSINSHCILEQSFDFCNKRFNRMFEVALSESLSQKQRV